MAADDPLGHTKVAVTVSNRPVCRTDCRALTFASARLSCYSLIALDVGFRLHTAVLVLGADFFSSGLGLGEDAHPDNGDDDDNIEDNLYGAVIVT